MTSINPKQRWALWLIAAVLLGAFLLQQMWTTSSQTEAISYSEFEKLAAEKKICHRLLILRLAAGNPIQSQIPL